MSLSINNNNSNRYIYEVHKQIKDSAITSEEESISFSKEVENYKNKTLTGMTEEDWKKFKELCKAYLKENPVETKEDMLKFKEYARKLLKGFGYKGDIEEYLNSLDSKPDVEKNTETKSLLTAKKNTLSFGKKIKDKNQFLVARSISFYERNFKVES